MELTFVPKEVDKAYIADSLWLPKSGVREGPVKRALEFTVFDQRVGQIMLPLWKESTAHVVCPREFLPSSEYGKYPFPFVDLRPQFETVEFEDLVVPRDEEQERAWAALQMHDNGILNLACGKGKTKLALKKIAQRSTPTLVIVPDTGILQQWVESVHGNGKDKTPGLRFDGEMGRIQGDVCDWRRPLTIALVTTIWKRIEDGALPEEMFRYFGQVVYDEVHRIGARKFSLAAEPFFGDRIGLTATVEREDGLDPIYRYHIGDPFYSDLSQQLIPEITFQQTPARIEWEQAKVNGVVNISKLRALIARSYTANVFRYWHIKAALEHGRKVLALSHSRHQLALMKALFPEAGLIQQETKDRMNVLRSHQLCFAIAKLGSEGVDDDALDTLFWLTPLRSRNAVQQSMGRVQRHREGKRKPLYIVFEDWMAAPIKKLCTGMKHELKKWGFPIQTLKPNNLPPELPTDERIRYDEAERRLNGEDEVDADAA